MSAVSLLVVDDEVQIRRFLRVALTAHGFAVREAPTGKEGLVAAVAVRPEIILLDLGLPDIDGLEVLKQLREWYTNPVLILSVRDEEATIVKALDLGADDYLTKPFGVDELLARIRVARRRACAADATPLFTSGPLRVDLAARTVSVGDSEVKLTATEFDLLKVLVKHAGKVVTHRLLLKEVWGPNAIEQVQYLRVYIGHLRQKIESDANRPKLLVTEPGVGYRLRVE